MSELRLLEGLIGFLLLLPLLKPFSNKLNLGGLVLLPPIGLGITAAVFPVYGFRTECLPLLVFALFETVLFIPSITMLLKEPRYDTSLNDRPLLFAISVIFLAGATGFALFFAPAEDAGLSAPGGIARLVQGPGGTGYTLRVYGSDESGEGAPPEGPVGTEPRPLMLLIPPRGGSIITVDRVCRELGDRGFTVISYSRTGPVAGKAREGMSLAEVYGLWSIHRRGHRSAAANAQGRALEAESLEDTGFLLSRIRDSQGRDPALAAALAGVDLRNIFLAGYGAGGGALIALASSPNFAAENPGVRGIISVEGPVFSAFREEAPPPPLPPRGILRDIPARIAGWFSRFRAKKIAGPGPGLVPGLPLLCIVSDRAFEDRHRKGRYAALFAMLRAAREPVALAAVPGAGPLDYSEIPEKHPIYRRFFPGGSGDIWKDRDFPGGTASLMANFAALFQEGRAGDPAGPEAPETGPRGIRRTALEAGIYLESGGGWIFHKPQDILGL
jgi:hypothetical protein